jgi:adenosine deaminase
MLQTLSGKVRPVFTDQAQLLQQKRTELTSHSPQEYRTPQGSTKTLRFKQSLRCGHGVLGFDSVLETFGCMEAAESLADDGG